MKKYTRIQIIAPSIASQTIILHIIPKSCGLKIVVFVSIVQHYIRHCNCASVGIIINDKSCKIGELEQHSLNYAIKTASVASAASTLPSSLTKMTSSCIPLPDSEINLRRLPFDVVRESCGNFSMENAGEPPETKVEESS